MNKMVQENGKVTYNAIFAGIEVTPIVKGVKFKVGQGILKRGTVIGLNTEGLGLMVSKGATDGSKDAIGVLTDTIDTTAVAEETYLLGQVYITGVFDGDALIFAPETKVFDYEKQLRTLGIFTKTVQE